MSERIDIKGWFHDDQDCISAELAEAYRTGKLQGAEKNAVERHLLTCDLCAEAWEGMEAAMADGSLQVAVTDITEQAWQRAEARERRKRRGAWIWMTSAAGVAILVVAGFLIMRNGSEKRMEDAFAQQFERYPEAPANEEKTDVRSADAIGKDLEMELPEDLKNKEIAMADAQENLEQRTVKSTIGSSDGWAPPPVVKVVPPAPPAQEDIIVEEEEVLMDKEVKNINLDPASFADIDDASPQFNYNSSVTTTTMANQPIMTSDAGKYELAEVQVADNRKEKVRTKASGMEKKAAPIVAQNTSPAKPNRSMDKGDGDFSGGKLYSEAREEERLRKDQSDSEEDADEVVTGTLGVAPGSQRDMKALDGLEKSVSEQNYYQAGRTAYDAGNYPSAYQLMQQELSIHPQNMDAKIYAGLSLLVQEKAAQALPIFRDVASSTYASANQKEDAEWYAALSLLKLKEKDKAITLLRNIEAKKGRYAAKATQTLQTLE